MKTTVEFFKTNYRENIFNEKVIADLINMGNNDFETEHLSVIHIFDNVPYIRNISSNKEWFNKNIYHFNKIN